MSLLQLTEEPDADEDDCAAIVQGLRDFNHRYMPRSAPEPLRLFLRDEFGAIQGGLLASTRWHWLLIDVLWVTDEHRGQGFGSALLERAEIIARSRGCRAALLDTREFQAQQFYERAGYRVFGELSDYPPGWRAYWMHKSLVTDTSSVDATEPHPPEVAI
jgi:GNAT superfamily N-acetyltransferase